MNYATISADVISYTSLNEEGKRTLETGIRQMLEKFTEKYKKHGFYGRLVQGDYIECALRSPEVALRIAILLKAFVKSMNLEIPDNNKAKLKYFVEHGVRIVVAVAHLTTLDPSKGIIDGEAVYLSGRTIKNLSTSSKQRVIIKNTMFFRSPDSKKEEQFDTIFSLIDTIASRWSSKQSEVIYYKLLDFNENEIGEKLGKYQSTISQHSTASGWLSIEKAVSYFEKTIQ